MAGAPQMQPGMMGAGGMPGHGMMAPGAAPGMHMMMPGSIPSAPLPVSMAQGGMQPGMMHGMGGMGVPGAQVYFGLNTQICTIRGKNIFCHTKLRESFD